MENKIANFILFQLFLTTCPKEFRQGKDTLLNNISEAFNLSENLMMYEREIQLLIDEGKIIIENNNLYLTPYGKAVSANSLNGKLPYKNLHVHKLLDNISPGFQKVLLDQLTRKMVHENNNIVNDDLLELLSNGFKSSYEDL